MAILKDRADFDGELLAARATLPHARTDGMLRFSLGFQAVGLAYHAAMRANRALRPARLLNKLAGLVFAAIVLCDVV